MHKRPKREGFRWRIPLLLAVAAALLWIAGVVRLGVDEEGGAAVDPSIQRTTAADATTSTDSGPVTAAGRQIFIDVETGEIMEPTLAQRRRAQRNLSPDVLDAMSTSHQGLVEEVMADGSARIDLRGRFHSASFATLDDSGNLTISHTPPPDLVDSVTTGGSEGDDKAQQEEQDDH